MKQDTSPSAQGRAFSSQPSMPGGMSVSRLSKLDDEMATLVESKTSGGVMGLIYRKGETAYFGAAGWRDIKAGKPIQRDTIMQIMSMTKPITAAAALTLVDDGKIGLHDPIEKYLPEFTDQRVLRTVSSELDDTVERKASITLADLLAFRAGLPMGMSPNPWAPPTPIKLAITDIYARHGDDADAWLKAVGALPLEQEPATMWGYGTAMEVVAALIARVSGMPFADYLQKRIFEPLGMKDTGHFIPPEKLDRLAICYQGNRQTGELDVMNVSFFTEYHPTATVPPFPRGGFGLVSTIDDFLQFARMLLGRGAVDGVRILSHRLALLMGMNYLTDAERATVPPPVAHQYKGSGWGFGMQVVVDPALQDKNVAYASEGAFGFAGALGTWFVVDPKEEMIQIFMHQMLSPTDLGRRRLQNLTYEAIEY